MGRRYDTARYLRSVELLRRHFPKPGITTDLIVGFPGETEEEFHETLHFLRRCAFSQLHIFPYSRRQGTPAADLPGQVPETEKRQRAQQAAAVAEALRTSWLESWLGERVPVLFEEEKGGLWRGHTPQYMEVQVEAPGQDLHNQMRTVRLTALGGEGALGVLEGKEGL